MFPPFHDKVQTRAAMNIWPLPHPPTPSGQWPLKIQIWPICGFPYLVNKCQCVSAVPATLGTNIHLLADCLINAQPN